VTWGEVKQQGIAIASHAVSRLKLKADGEDVKLIASNLLFNQHSDGGYVVLEFTTDAPGDANVIDVQYSLLFDIDPTHRGLVLYENDGRQSTYVISPTAPQLVIKKEELGLWRSFLVYLVEGVWHIWIGFDHVLFLLTLLLPAVLVWRGKRWRAVKSFRPAVEEVLKIVSVFTVAHSITLWLAVMEYVTLPSRLIEVTIAASIIFTALNNVFRFSKIANWKIAFAFGLIHGFGFANVLLDLGLSSTTLGVSLLGFNVGVELGQLAIVLVFLPIAYYFRRRKFYRTNVFRYGSLIIAAVALVWMIERIFNAQIITFS
jgi:hypothetical protein